MVLFEANPASASDDQREIWALGEPHMVSVRALPPVELIAVEMGNREVWLSEHELTAIGARLVADDDADDLYILIPSSDQAYGAKGLTSMTRNLVLTARLREYQSDTKPNIGRK